MIDYNRAPDSVIGAVLLIALVVLIACIGVGAAVITMASVGMGH